MYYSAGTYESFAHPEKPKDVDKKSAYIIGTGLAGLTAAFYLVRDGQMKGEHIHVFEKLDLAGGICDGRKDITKGFFMRGGREMDNHFEVMWDTFRDVPSIETPGISVLDEYYWLNKHDPNYSLCRASVNRGEDAHTDKQFKLDKDSAMALSKLFMTPEKDLEDKKISDVLPDSFWNTNFWLYWQTMFAFQRWSSALEMKRYLCRYVHHIDGLPDFSALRFTKYNQYESMILPLVKYLESHGVHIEYGMDVRNVIIETEGDKKVARQIVYVKDGREQTIDLIEDDLVFITNGCCTDTSCYGDQTHAPDLSGVKNGAGESWDMWKAIAAQAEHGEYGNPDAFCSDVDATNWMSATVATSNQEIIRHVMSICKRDPRSGKVTTGGIVTVKDSTDNWYLSWTINRQPQFKSQDKNMVLVWLYSLNTNREGNYVKKAMRDCTGEEVMRGKAGSCRLQPGEYTLHYGAAVRREDGTFECRYGTADFEVTLPGFELTMPILSHPEDIDLSRTIVVRCSFETDDAAWRNFSCSVELVNLRTGEEITHQSYTPNERWAFRLTERGAYRAVATVSNGSETLVIRKDFVLPELTNPKDIYHTLNWRAIDFDKVIQYYIDFYSDEACTEKLSLQHSAACHYIVWRRHHDAEGNPTKNDKVMEDTVMLPAGVTTYNLPYTFEAKDYLTLHGYRYDYEIVGIEYR